MLKDPNTTATPLEISASTSLLLNIQTDMSTSADMLNTIESVRAQVQTLSAQVAANPAMADVRAGGDSLEKRLTTTEGNLIDLRMTGRGQDEVRYPARIGAQLNYLAGGIAASDFTPTAQQRSVDQLLAKEVKDTRSDLEAVLKNDLGKFNALLRTKGLKPIEASLGGIVF